ncbi:MAG: hypothetical protein HY719_16605, partial [Planctomycetes bacterium]|nr:hypothetical protein [Planctomycetota bacterium]
PHLHVGSRIGCGPASFGRFHLALVQRQRLAGRASAAALGAGAKWHDLASGPPLFRPFIDACESLADRGPGQGDAAFASRFSSPRFLAYRFSGEAGADEVNVFDELITGAREWLTNASLAPPEHGPKGIGARPGLKLTRSHTDELQDVLERLTCLGVPGVLLGSAEGLGSDATIPAALAAARDDITSAPSFTTETIGREIAAAGGGYDAQITRWRMDFDDTARLAPASAAMLASATVRVRLSAVNLVDDFQVRLFRRASAASALPEGEALGSASTASRFAIGGVSFLDLPCRASGVNRASATRFLFIAGNENDAPAAPQRDEMLAGGAPPRLFVRFSGPDLEMSS